MDPESPTGDRDPTGRGPARSGAIVLAALVAACLASLVWLASPWYDLTAPGTADASVYLLCARALASGQGYSYLGMPFNMRPPGLSAILAPLVAWRGFDFHAINLVIGAFGVGLVAVLYVLARPRVGTLAAASVAVLLWMSPAMRSMSNQAMSDVPGAALAFACLAIEARARKSASVRADVATGLAIAAAMYVRTVNLLLVPAILASRWLAPPSLAPQGLAPPGLAPPSEMRKRSFPGALALAGIPILLLVPWLVRNARHHPPWPATQTASATYVSNFLNVDGGDPSSRRVALREYLPRIPGQVGETLAAIGRRLEPGPVDAGHAALGALVVLALVGSAARRRGATEIFAVLALLELAVHPAFDERFVLPIAVVGLVALVELARGALGRAIPARLAELAVAALLLALLVLDFDPRPNWKAIEADFRARRELAAAWNASLPKDARLASNIGWHWSVFLERPVYSLFFAARRSGGPEGADFTSRSATHKEIGNAGADEVYADDDPEENRRRLRPTQEHHDG